jgi:hypothetical protein
MSDQSEKLADALAPIIVSAAFYEHSVLRQFSLIGEQVGLFQRCATVVDLLTETVKWTRLGLHAAWCGSPKCALFDYASVVSTHALRYLTVLQSARLGLRANCLVLAYAFDLDAANKVLVGFPTDQLHRGVDDIVQSLLLVCASLADSSRTIIPSDSSQAITPSDGSQTITIRKHCGNPLCLRAATQRCAGCPRRTGVRYCTTTCQKMHWPFHKKQCPRL